MTWSDWIQGSDLGLNVDIVQERESAIAGTGEVVAVGVFNDIVASLTWQTYLYTVQAASREGILATPAAGWDTHRQWWPSLLNTLVEDVDFSVRPDRVITDDDAYVEYELGVPNAIAGWYLPDLLNQWSTASSAYYPTGSQLQVELHTGLPPVAPGSPPAFPGIGSGTVLAIYTSDVGGVTLPVADPGPVTSVGLFVYDPNYSATPPFEPGGAEFSVQGSANWMYPNRPFVYVTLPRFRYWVPGEAFLWNAQRTGGGGRSAGRGRGNTTQQGSCRNRGGIH